MVKTSELKPGRIYSFVYRADVEMVAKKRDGRENPLADCACSVRRVCRVQAAGEHTYARAMLAKDATWQPSEKLSWHVASENPCVRVHGKDANRRYLRAIPIAIDKETYFIGNVPANEAESEVIRAFKKGGERDEKPAYILFNLDNVENLHDNGGQEE